MEGGGWRSSATWPLVGLSINTDTRAHTHFNTCACTDMCAHTHNTHAPVGMSTGSLLLAHASSCVPLSCFAFHAARPAFLQQAPQLLAVGQLLGPACCALKHHCAVLSLALKHCCPTPRFVPLSCTAVLCCAVFHCCSSGVQ